MHNNAEVNMADRRDLVKVEDEGGPQRVLVTHAVLTGLTQLIPVPLPVAPPVPRFGFEAPPPPQPASAHTNTRGTEITSPVAVFIAFLPRVVHRTVRRVT